jgi:hypothetical protein
MTGTACFCLSGRAARRRRLSAPGSKQNDTFRRADRGELVSVHFKTFDVEGSRTFGLWWDEVTPSLAGQVTAQKSYRARVVYEMHIPSAQKAREENPLGCQGEKEKSAGSAIEGTITGSSIEVERQAPLPAECPHGIGSL